MLSQQYRKMRFLVLDDFDSFRKIMLKMLRDLGANPDLVDDVATASSALSLCEQVPFDVILSDYSLGKGQNGQQFLEELHHRNSIKHSTVFIMVTAEVNKDTVLTALECQPDAYLTKPFTVGSLKNRMEKLLIRNDHLKDILSALDQEDLVGAIEFCDKHMSASSSHANWCLKTKADLHFRLKDYDKALKVYQDVLRSREVDWALLGQGKAFCEKGDFQEAVSTLMKLISKNTLFLTAYDWLAKSQLGLGETNSAQQVLEKAVSISALSVPRQQLLAEVCHENHDLRRASNAYRRTVALAENSIHHSADNGLNLARCLTESAASMDEADAKEFADEALVELSKINKEFDTKEVAVQAKLVEARAYCATGQKDKGRQTLSEASRLSEGLEDALSTEMKLEFARAYSSTDNKEEEIKILKQLADDHGSDEKIASQIDRMLDEPLTASGKEKARRINDRGIAHYKSQKYFEAITEFGQALKQYPNNILFILNLATALISDIENNGSNAQHKKKM